MYYEDMDSQEPTEEELKLQDLIDQIPEKGISPLLTYGNPDICVLVAGKSGIQTGSDLYFYPCDFKTEEVDIIIDPDLQQKLIKISQNTEDDQVLDKVVRLIECFTEGSNCLEEGDIITCYLNSTNTGILIVLQFKGVQFTFTLINNIECLSTTGNKKTKFKVYKNLIPNSVTISVI